jgi:hypothetical protein
MKIPSLVLAKTKKEKTTAYEIAVDCREHD